MQPLSIDAWIALGTTFLCLAGLARYRHAPDVIMLGGVTVLLATGVIGVPQALAGFANEGVLTIAALFIVVAGLRESGVVAGLGTAVLGHPQSVRRAMARMFVPVAGASSVINNTPIVALFVPAIVDWAERHNLSAGRLLLPLSYIAIAAGTCSLLGSATNLIANSLLIEASGEGIGLFSPAWLGIPLLLVSAVYLLIFAPVILRPGKGVQDMGSEAQSYFIEFSVDDAGPLVGRTITQAGLRHLRGVYLAQIERKGQIIEAVAPTEILLGGDRLGFVGNADNIADLLNTRGLSSAKARFETPQRPHSLSEVVVGTHSALIGKTIRECRFRTQYQGVILSVRRHGELLRYRKIGNLQLEGGDTLLVSSAQDFAEHRGSREFLLIRSLGRMRPLQYRKSGFALAVFVAMIALAASGAVPLLTASWLAAGLLLAGRCLDASSARKSLDISVLTVIAASIAVGSALADTGVAAAFAQGLAPVIPQTPYGAVFGIFMITSILSALVTNSAAVVMVFPVAMGIAQGSGLGGEATVMAVIAGASASFATPIAYQTNLMVQGPGRYGFGDYLRLGVPLTFLFAVVSTLLIPSLFG